MTFKKGDIVWIKHEDIGFIKGEISKKVMPYHGVGFDKDYPKWYVFVIELADFNIPYYESDLISWIREKKINDITE